VKTRRRLWKRRNAPEGKRRRPGRSPGRGKIPDLPRILVRRSPGLDRT